MACHAVQMWSLSGLVAAFLDLTIAYFLLCASAAAYLASKFLGFFGLNLPCPCDGMFINVHSKSLCFNRLLVDVPLQKLSDVQLSVRQKFPFTNSASPRKYDGSVFGDNCGNGIFQLEGEVSCSSSVSDARESLDVVRREISSRAGKIDMKGKGILSYRPKSRLRHRRAIGTHGKNLSLLSFDPPLHEEVSDSETYHLSTNKRGSWCTGDGSLPTDSEDHNHEYEKSPKKKRGRRRTLSRDEMNLSSDVDTYLNENIQSGEELQYNQLEIQSYGGDENNKIRILEQALERECAARAALHVELEKERSAAASAADEAMAMILRLQEEKACIEMESRQYQRIIEEKSAYDDEEMDILQEILMRREREKLFLEKEVEAYREMVSQGNGQLIGDLSDNNDSIQVGGPLKDPSDDPDLNTEDKWADDVLENRFKSKPASGIALPSFERLRDSNENSVHMSVLSSSGKMDLQTEVISSGKDIQMIPKNPPECKTAISSQKKELEQAQESNQEHKLEEKVIMTCYGTEKDDLKLILKLDDVPQIYDVHIVDDGIKQHSEETVDKEEQLSTSNSLEVLETESVQSESSVKKNSSEVTSCLPPIKRRSSFHSLRRSSMSALDSEMLKIDSEIVQLRERLKHVQQGREKLSFSLENRESRNTQLNILEDIARQIQKIRRLNGPQRSVRQASLPPPNSKVFSKRRRSRSVSSGFQMS